MSAHREQAEAKPIEPAEPASAKALAHAHFSSIWTWYSNSISLSAPWAERVGVSWGIPERLPAPTSPSHARGVGPSLSPLKGGEGLLTRPARCARPGAKARAVETCLRTFDKIRQIDQSAIADDKRLGSALAMIRDEQLRRGSERRSGPRRRDQRDVRLLKVG